MEKVTSGHDFIKMEHDVLKFWEENQCFDKLREKNKDNEPFRFLDGPITANNPMGIHHAWGRTIKDIFLRYKAMNGYSGHYRNGFDAQGLWVEVEVERELGFKSKRDIEEFGMDNFTRKCVERIQKYSKTITEQSKRLGQWMDWDNSYYTHTDTNITGIWAFLKKCHENGWIGQSYRPMPWCPRCGTSLSEHEMSGSYKELEHLAVYFKLPLVERNARILVWTTTPWTLSSNVALAVNPEIDYCEVMLPDEDRPLILAKNALSLVEKLKPQVLKEFKGEELVGLHYETCFPELPAQKEIEHKVVPWADVDPKEGTGVVHIAPGCGAEDFELGKSIGLTPIVPVDETGIFTEGFEWLSGKKVQEVADLVIEKLEAANKLFKGYMHKHSYPICWRCKTEVIFRLVREWHIKTDEIKPRLLEEASKVNWEPEYIGKRMNDWLTNMGDWNISRKRFYGLPLPFYPCEECGEVTVVGSKQELRELGGPEVDKLPELHRPWIDEIKIKCPKCGKPVSRVTEVGDVWLDAGITPFSTLGYFEDREQWEKYFPIEWVTEMREQIRLWFYSLLFMSVTLVGRAPYQRVLSYNSVISEDGTRFSKTGFMIKFDEAAEKIGVDSIRYLFAGANVSSDVRFGYGLGDEARRRLLGFWNVYSFFNMYASLDNPDIAGFVPSEERFTKTDKWLLTRTNVFVNTARGFMEEYQTPALIKEFEAFIDDVSNWYIRVNRRRFWKVEDEADKQVAYWCLYQVIKTSSQVMAPIIPFMTEYIWNNAVRHFEPNSPISIHLSDWPKTIEGYDNEALLEETSVVRQLIALALRLRTENQLKVRQPLARLYVAIDKDKRQYVENMLDIISDELNIKNIEFIEDRGKLDDPYLILNFRKAGAILKGDVQLVKGLLEKLDAEHMNKAVAQFDANEQITLPEWKDALSPELFLRQTKPKSDTVVGSDEALGITAALDVKLTDELIAEGLYREVVRQCQVLRKEAGLKVEQRISLGMHTDSALLSKVIKEYAQQITKETLADNLLDKVDEAVFTRVVDINDDKLTVSIKAE